ncbi:response regulator [Alkalilimnicola sp. S0819]|uniref:response regulator n=1 Tax=Alkalilimnicola sp. S0819 TaxID=2613922 RepID=UPI0012622F88|nr:response regulator [Alkalilimnicola sp. S0819]KAB7623414.1 response regulator [Alkalilimnicola sp. S0819]MPQ16960.1 response regulator [Alkalilimnicola sp. S0819]
MHVLLIEDDPLVGEGIQVGLRLQGVTVDWLDDGRQAAAILPRSEHDVVILDLALPGRSGLQLLQDLRDAGRTTPVLILTAFDAVEERVAGLDAGADDYLAKPFDLKELAARLRALSRRRQGRASARLQHGRLSFDPATLEARLDDEAVPLPRREAVLLQLLLENRGQIVSLERIHDQLYGWNEGVESNAPAVHIHNLRRKLGKDLIETVRGVGYRIPRSAS